MKSTNKNNRIKILLISASPNMQKSVSYYLAKQVIKGFPKSGVDVETVHLFDNKISFCLHLDKCHDRIMACPQKDDVDAILEKMLGADGIILATPNYMGQLSAIMKTLIERSSHFTHCKRLLGKYIIGVAASGRGQCQNIMDYLKDYSNSTGAMFSGGVFTGRTDVKAKAKEAVKLGKEFINDIKHKNICPKQMATIEKGKQFFCEVMKARKHEWKEEYKYWQNQGWL